MLKVFLYMSSAFHNAYRHMADNAPTGFEVTRSEFMAHAGAVGSGGMLKGFLRRIQPAISPAYNDFLITLNRPKTRSFPGTDYDLIHSGQSLLKTEVPYVVDFEHAAVFSGYNQYAFGKEGFRKALKKLMLDKKLRKLMPWTNAARESLLNFINDRELGEKVETVYPVMTPPEKIEREKHDGVNFFFVGGAFYEKGAYDAVLAFDSISSKYDATLTIVSDAPEEVVRKFGHNQRIRFLGKKPYEEVKKLYLESDAFVFPTHYDTFGFVIPEAFSYALPVISVDSFSTPELVEHGRTGLLVKSYYSSFLPDRSYRYETMGELGRRRLKDCKNPTEEYLKELSGAMERLILDGRLMRRMSGNARKEALAGKFSPKVWKRKMGRIYGEALRN
ncbi:MAG: glycosyltransferase family 4 protein [Candidatus Micrarchaeota archaeon]